METESKEEEYLELIIDSAVYRHIFNQPDCIIGNEREQVRSFFLLINKTVDKS